MKEKAKEYAGAYCARLKQICRQHKKEITPIAVTAAVCALLPSSVLLPAVGVGILILPFVTIPKKGDPK